MKLWKRIKETDLGIVILILITLLSLFGFFNYFFKYETGQKDCIIIEKDETINAAWKLIEAQDRLIRYLSEQNKMYDYYLGLTKEQIDEIEKKEEK